MHEEKKNHAICLEQQNKMLTEKITLAIKVPNSFLPQLSDFSHADWSRGREVRAIRVQTMEMR